MGATLLVLGIALVIAVASKYGPKISLYYRANRLIDEADMKEHGKGPFTKKP